MQEFHKLVLLKSVRLEPNLSQILKEVFVGLHILPVDLLKDVENSLLSFPWNDDSKYAMLLAQTYFLVSHTTRLISLAASRLNISNSKYHNMLIKHIGEELGHEDILIEDLLALGHKIEEYSPLPTTSLLLHTLYHSIERVSPLSIFGRIIFLEYLCAKSGEKWFKKLMDVGRTSHIRFIKLHIEEDVKHIENSLPILQELSIRELSDVADSFVLTGYLYKELFSDCNTALPKVT